MVVHRALHGDGKGKAMRIRFISTWAVLTLLVVVSGTWAQSTDETRGQSIAALKEYADKGDAQAQATLGFYFEYGLFVPKDCSQALFGITRQPNRGGRAHSGRLAFNIKEDLEQEGRLKLASLRI